MRILHTADWHLGKLFHGLHLTEDQALLFERELVPLVRDFKPDVVLVAGDIFDRPIPPAEAVSLLSEILTRLHETGTKIILLPGNHDSAERLAFARDLLSRLHIFVASSDTYLFEPLKISNTNFFLIPHLSPLELRELLKQRGLLSEDTQEIRDLWETLLKSLPKGGERRILSAHLFVEGGKKGDSETNLWVGGEEALPESLFSDFDLVLLGHLHRHQSPAENVLYSGSLLPLSFSEVGQAKGVVLLEVSSQARPHREFIPLTPPREFLVVEEYFAELLHYPKTEAYVKAILRDENPVPEAFERLRKVFPNLLALETPYLRGEGGELSSPEIDLCLDERELFKAFLREITGRPPSSEETYLFEEGLNSLRHLST
ncbi:exonuclease SbcCD subunit D [Thermosulfurimonas dismutans]|uniref:Nuclease SbcCD subunit D n=1 Tax=Thermosulfurimonas dismutans TaxID=999894 RepID=A0A179D7Y8_9BACT|nr:exonuclease SbcCD subunit D [Thermosulfurimonas dismutans]OAQ21881.1 Exonuclease SbcD [Thermosulfurimonas dismutans]